MSKLEHLQDIFTAEIGAIDLLLRVPGRANIIGEHIDYCNASVLPFAIEQSMYFAAKKRGDNLIYIKALDMDEQVSLRVGQFNKTEGWANYFDQAISIVSSQYNLSGLDVYFSSDIPIGAGVSSSSALCVGFITILDSVFGLNLSNDEKVDIASQTENGIGIRGGIMDQYTILNGSKNQALLIDCDTSSHHYVDLSDMPYEWILLNTKVEHDLSNSPYNTRRGQTEKALQRINDIKVSTHTFRTVSKADIDLLNGEPLLQDRIRHIHTEINRVTKAVEYINKKQYHRLGELLNQSHYSLSKHYEVSCPELDFICDYLSKDRNVLGARIMGGGFGGSVIAMVDQAFESDNIVRKYFDRYYLKADVIAIQPSDGLEIM